MNLKILISSIVILLLFSFNTFSQTIYTSVATGNWGNASTWDQLSTPGATDHVVVAGGHTVTVNVNNAVITNLTINSTGVLNVGNKGLQTDGNLLVNGTYTGNRDLEFTGGSGQTVAGVGVIKVNFNFNGNAQILSGANLSVIASTFLDNNVVVTNNGKFTINNDLRGSNAGSTWVNAANSTLQLSDELFPAQGTLTASASGNTVIYNSEVNHQNILTPTGNTYYNVEFTGIKEKRAQGILYITGNVTINSGIFVSNNHTIYVRGNWTSFSHFEEGSGLVVFDGTSDQILARPGGEMFYNCEIDKSSGTFFVNDQLTISNSLTMTSGNIDVGHKTITLGTDAGNIGTLSHTSGSVIGKFERWIIASGSAYLFPVGTTSDFRPAYSTFATIQTVGTVAFEFIPESPGSAGLSLVDGAATIYNTFLDGYWDLTEDNSFRLGNSNDFDLDLYGTNFISFTIDADTRLLTRDDAASDWTAEGTHGTNSAPMVQRTGIGTSPAQFCFGDDTNCTPPTTSAVSGNVDVCTGASDEIYSVTDNGNTYYWSIEGGTQTGGTNTNSITVDWGVIGMIGSVTVMEHNGCTYSEAVVLDVNIHSIQVAEITGKTNVPENTLGEPYSVIPIVGYTYDWTVSGGTIAGGDGTENITIDWGTVGTGNVSVISQKVGCSDSPPTDIDVNIYYAINSIKTGDWNDATTWDCNCIPDITDNTRIINPHTVTLDANEEIHHFTVDAGATLEMVAKTFKCTGDITVDGTLTSSGSKDITLEATGNIDGTGTISAGNIYIKGNKTILSSALLTVSAGNIDLNNINSFMITNYGQITVANDIIGKSSSAKYWTNGINSTLNIGGILLSDGQLIAEAEGNTVNYNGTINQTIKDPDSDTDGYRHLTASNSGIKTPEANLDVNGNLTINGSTQLDVATGNFNINIAGDWINTSINADPFLQGNTTETVTFDGTGDQTIICSSTEMFNNFSVALNSNTILTAGNTVTVNGSTTLTGTLTLKSPANDYDPSASFIDNGTINIISTGKMNAERYINGMQWHEVSAPVASADVTSALFTRSHSSGDFNPNFYIFDETVDLDGDPLTEPAGAFDSNNLIAGWAYAHNGDAGADINLNETAGYMFYTTENQLIEYSGTPNTGNFDATGLSFTANDPDDDGNAIPNLYDGWHLLGNPYPSSINWDLIRDDQLTNVDDGVYIWDNNQYAGYQNGISVMSGNLSNNIAPMQGFFVHSNATGAEVQIRNEHRTHSSQEYLKGGDVPVENLIKLKTSANGYVDYMAVYFLPDAGKEYDGDYDLVRMFTTDINVPQLFTVTESEEDPLALSCLPDSLLLFYSVPIGFRVGTSGTYTISVNELNSFYKTQVYLEDLLTGTMINLRVQDAYEFDFSSGDVKDRFVLHFNNNSVPVYQSNLENITSLEDELFEFSIPENTFIDIDYNDQITLSAKLANGQSLPDWLNFEDDTFFGTPENDDVGILNIMITASDLLNATASATFELEVINTNDAPYVANHIENQSMELGKLYVFIIPENVFNDIDVNDKLTVYTEKLPNWLTFSPLLRTLTGNPDMTGKYDIEIFAKDIAGATASDIFELDVYSATSIENNDIEVINIYPNPNNGIFTFDISENIFKAGMYLNITNITGKKIFTHKITGKQTKIDISEHPKGVYFLNLFSGNNTMNFNKISFKVILH